MGCGASKNSSQTDEHKAPEQKSPNGQDSPVYEKKTQLNQAEKAKTTSPSLQDSPATASSTEKATKIQFLHFNDIYDIQPGTKEPVS